MADEKRYKRRHLPCIILIGMPGAGKTTIGELLAEKLGWAFMDSDKALEALYGARLQDIFDALGKEEFIRVEGDVIASLDISRCVLATGGSVIYRKDAMEHLKQLGRVIYLETPLDQIVKRIAENPERGIALAPGQTLEDLFAERQKLYLAWAEQECPSWGKEPLACAEKILKELPESLLIKGDEELQNCL